MTLRPKPRRPVVTLALAALALVIAASCAAVVVHLVDLLGDRGLEADAHGTSGYTTTGELIALVGGVIGAPLFFLLALVLLVVGLARWRSPR